MSTYDETIADRYEADQAERADAAEKQVIDAIEIEVQREMWEIATNEGAYHVDGRYYANLDDADRQRRWLAERRVRDRVRGVAA